MNRELNNVRRQPGRIALALIYALLALNAWAQVVFALRGELSDPPILIGLQTLIGIAGTVAAWGAWAGTRWVAYAVVIHGLITATMLVLLDPIVGLGADARSWLFIAAAAVLAWTFLFAWYLNRLVRRHRGEMTARDAAAP